jgi:hypothetical protein
LEVVTTGLNTTLGTIAFLLATFFVNSSSAGIGIDEDSVEGTAGHAFRIMALITDFGFEVVNCPPEWIIRYLNSREGWLIYTVIVMS